MRSERDRDDRTDEKYSTTDQDGRDKRPINHMPQIRRYRHKRSDDLADIGCNRKHFASPH